MIRLVFFVFLLCLEVVAAPLTPKVVMISLDGLRPEFYLDSRWPAPYLQSLYRQGASVQALYSVFPSITYANHTSLATGVYPAQHGIDCNIDFDWVSGPMPDWNWQASKIKAPTLWDLARRRHLTTAALSWPVTLGADIDYLIPEVFSVAGANQGSTEELIRAASTSGLIVEIQQESEKPFPISFADWDAWLPAAAGYIWRNKDPQLTLIHMLNLDWTQHRFGPDSLETRQALMRLDTDLQHLVEQVNLDDTFLMIVGDHGFLPVKSVLNPNRLFYDRGWIKLERGKIKSWKVYARSNGGSAAIYCKDFSLAAEVRSLLQRYSAGRWTVLQRDELDARKTFAGADLAISVVPGLALGQSVDGPFESPGERPTGQHGHLPEQLPTGWLILVPGIQAGQDLGQRSLLEVAPTVGRLLNLDCSTMESKGLQLLP